MIRILLHAAAAGNVRRAALITLGVGLLVYGIGCLVFSIPE